MSSLRVISKVKVSRLSRLSKDPKLNLIFTKALLKDRQNLDWVGVGPEASIGKAILKPKAILGKVSLKFITTQVGFF